MSISGSKDFASAKYSVAGSRDAKFKGKGKGQGKARATETPPHWAPRRLSALVSRIDNMHIYGMFLARFK